MLTRLNTARILYPLIFAAVLLGIALVVYATAAGPGVGGDATIYLTSARNLLDGQGLGFVEPDGSFRLLPYTPPFYPLVLSAMGLFSADLVSGARWLNVLLFGLTIFMMGVFFYRFTHQVWLASLLSAALAASPVILNVQVWAMSEPLFLLLGFAGLLMTLEYLNCPRMGVLLAAALLCGLAVLTRYIGVAFVAAAGLALLLFWPNTRKGRMSSAFVFGLLAVLPMLIWLAVDFFSTGTVGSRSAQPASAYWQRFLEMGAPLENITLFWLLPDSVAARLPRFIRVLLWLAPLTALAVLAAAVARRVKSAPGKARVEPAVQQGARMAALFGLFIVFYLIVLAAVQVFTFPPVTLASRMLSPVHFAVLVLIFSLLHLSLRLLVPAGQGGRVITALVYLGCLGLIGSYALRGALVARDYHNGGIGYMSPVWQAAPMLETLRGLDAGVPIITNETTAVMFFLNRPAYAIQEIYQSQPSTEFSVYGQGDDEAQRVFQAQGGALVLFYQTLYEDYAMYGERAEERIRSLTAGLAPYYQGEDGAIYFAQPRP